MSFFGETLKKLMHDQDMSMVELSRMSGVGTSKLSRLVNGEQTFVDPVDMAALCKSISPEPEKQAELIRGHLLDESKGPGSELIEIRITGTKLHEERPTQNAIRLSPVAEDTLQRLRTMIPDNPQLLDALTAWLDLLDGRRR
jgi:DNA-binding Xre family transcriptional regulator